MKGTIPLNSARPSLFRCYNSSERRNMAWIGSMGGSGKPEITSARGALQARLELLRAKHRELEEELARIIRRPAPDAVEVAGIKKRKLRIRDEIVHLERTLYPDQPA